ncbi:MAG: M56 family metallopeptidase [Oscillospiraceae bacterium]|jgi:beta-lactamase regulating signal transducer with metallopeptidase domain|nr:M56 family metallopeptidase [Oscillospiraceae bacterium]
MSDDILRAVLTMSIAGSVLAAVFFALKPLVRYRLPRFAQYALWLVVLAALLVPFSSFVKLPQSVAETAFPATIRDTVERYIVPDTAPYIPDAAPITPDAPAATQPLVGKPAFTVKSLLFPTWLCGFALSLVVNMVGYLRFLAKLRRRNVLVTEIDCPLRVYRNALAPTPMLIGLFRPVIVLPDARYSAAQLENILRHEMAHHRRRDIAVKWLSVFAGAVHWFNPMVYLARRELDRACELACDEAVIAKLDADGKQRYGDTLIAVAADKRIPAGVLSATMCEEKRALKERLGAIMKNKKRTVRALVISAILLIAAVSATVLIGAAADKGDPIPAVTSPVTPPATAIPEGLQPIASYALDGESYSAYLAENPAETPTFSNAQVEENTLSSLTLKNGADIRWISLDGHNYSVWRAPLGEWHLLTDERDITTYDGYSIETFDNLFGHDGFYLVAPRGSSNLSHDYFYFDADGVPQLLILGAYADAIGDFNGDGIHEYIWFYHSGREMFYIYMRDGRLYQFDVVTALLSLYPNREYTDDYPNPHPDADGMTRIFYHLKNDTSDPYTVYSVKVAFTPTHMLVFDGETVAD